VLVHMRNGRKVQGRAHTYKEARVRVFPHQTAALVPQHCVNLAGSRAMERGAAPHLYAPLAEHGHRTHDVAIAVALQGVVEP